MVSAKIYELGIAKQTAMGDPATAAAFKTRVTGGDVMPLSNIQQLNETGRNRLPRTLFKASAGADGNPSLAVREHLAGFLLWGALGTKSVSGGADPYAHEITPANTTPYFTIWRMFGDMVWEKFIDCKIAQLDLVSEAEQALAMTLTIVGTKAVALDQATYNTEVAVGYSDDDPVVHHHGSGLLLVEGAAVSRMERVALSIVNGSARQFGDSIFADDVSEGAQTITVATRERVIAPALYNRLHYGTATPTTGTEPTGDVIELGGGGLDLMWRRVAAAPGPERSIRLVSGSRVQVSGIGAFAPTTGDDPIRMEPTYAILDPDSGAAFTATVKNGVATY